MGRHPRQAVGLIAIGALVATAFPAAAEVLTEGAARRLCQGGRVVPSRLAFAIVSEARAATFAATANDHGTSPFDLTAEEAVQVLRAVDDQRPAGHPASEPWAPRAFGPDIDLITDPEAMGAWERIAALTLGLADLSGRPTVAGRVTYQLVRIGGPVVSPDEPRFNSAQLFDERPVYEIACFPTPGAAPNGPVTPEPGPVTPTPDRAAQMAGIRTRAPTAPPPAFRVRGAASDLYLSGSDLSVLKPATIGFSRDEIASTETVTINAAVGLAFETPDLVWAATPFVAWSYKDVTGAGDIDLLTPGVLLSHRLAGDDVVLHSRLELAYLINREQSSEQLRARLYVDPTIRTPGGLLFGDWLNRDARVRFRPDLTLIADLSEVRDPGSNAAFLAGGSYQGLGGDLRLLVDSAAVEGLTLLVGRRQLWLSGDLAIDEAARWYGRLEYKFKTSPIGLALTYSEGQNDDTFQDEDTTTLELTFRY